MRPLSSFVAVVLTLAILAPSAFLVAPKQAHAVTGVPTGEVPYTTLSLKSVITSIQSTLTAIQTYTSAVADVAQYVNTYVLQPLAFALSGQLMKKLTSGVLSFVMGQANRTGIPQFVTDLNATMQTVGDSQALAFFTQWGKNSNSPFASSIGSSLRSNYMKNTSLAGFWSANMCTLSKSSKDVNRFLAGDWSKGGATAWFALTTQPQNNPFSLYQRANSQLDTLAVTAKDVRQKDIAAGQGFMSWCGGIDTTVGAFTTTSSGVKPGDPCTDANGKSGTIKTPGSVISATLNKVLGGQQDQVVRMGNVGPQINNILKDVASVVQTVQFGINLLGGNGSGGLLGAGQTSASGAISPIRQLAIEGETTSNMGVSAASIRSESTKIVGATDEMNNRLTESNTSNTTEGIMTYKSSWLTINNSAEAASTTVSSLIAFCVSQQKVAKDTLENYDRALFNTFMQNSNSQITSARNVLSGKIAEVFTQVEAANKIIADAEIEVKKIQDELAAAASTVDAQAIQNIPPTRDDVSSAQQNAGSSMEAVATPSGSLNVSGGSIVDRMNLIKKNAEELKTSACTVPDLPYSYGNISA